MIPKPLLEIGESDLHALRDNRVVEGKTIEYKRDLPGRSDGDRIGFLRAVSAFANTEGGDLLYGVDTAEGIPTGFPGIGQVDQDELKQRLENLCRDGIEPRLPNLDFRLVVIEHRPVLIVRVAKSWMSPHRVKLLNHGHFYGRNSAGAFPLDVGELRTAFTLSENTVNRIRDFRAERLLNLHAHHTPIPIRTGCKMALHIIPLSAFATTERIDIAQYQKTLHEFRPLGRDSHDVLSRFNLDGMLNYVYTRDDRSPAYTQVFRSGIVEAVAVFSEQRDGQQQVKRIHSKTYEAMVIRGLQGYINQLYALDVNLPILVFLALVNATDFVFSVPSGPGEYFGYETNKADRDMLDFSEVVIADYGIEAHTLLKPIFDAVWNAFGYAASANYGLDGKWK